MRLKSNQGCTAPVHLMSCPLYLARSARTALPSGGPEGKPVIIGDTTIHLRYLPRTERHRKRGAGCERSESGEVTQPSCRYNVAGEGGTDNRISRGRSFFPCHVE